MIKPVIMAFRGYVRIAPHLALVAIVGQARLSGTTRECGGGHGTINGRPASGVRGATGSACEPVHASTSTPRLPLMCERVLYQGAPSSTNLHAAEPS